MKKISPCWHLIQAGHRGQMKEAVFAYMTVVKLIPEKVGDTIAIIQGAVCQTGSGEIRGLRRVLLLESQEEPGRLTWLTTWDSPAAAEVFFSSPLYADLLSQVQDILLRQPEGFRFSVLAKKSWEFEGFQAWKGGGKKRDHG
jgi:quinol monooxygenase YgiN